MYNGRKIEFGPIRATAVLTFTLAAVGVISALRAYEKPLWYDEICTAVMCRLPTVTKIWEALSNAADTNPPPFYLLARAGRLLIPDDHLGYRLPSLLCFLGTLVCVYLIASRRVDRLSGLTATTFLLSTRFIDFAAEARPYAPLILCVSAAILFWQRVDRSPLYYFALAIALACAVSMHYYAIFVWPAFIAAEAWICLYYRRFRAGTWIALLLGITPLFFFSSLLVQLKRYYGPNFWAHPHLKQILSGSAFVLNIPGRWPSRIAVGALAVLVCWSLAIAAASWRAKRWPLKSAIPVEEWILAGGLLAIPVIAVVFAKVTGGGLANRYMLPAVLGYTLILAYLTARTKGPVKILLLTVMLLTYGWSSVPIVRSAVNGSLLQRRTALAGRVESIAADAPAPGVPIALSNGREYLQIAYYTPASLQPELYMLVDPAASLKYTGTDSVDLALLILRQYFPLQVEDYHDFSSMHRDFILVGGGWWVSRLKRDGHAVSLVGDTGAGSLYGVRLNLAP